MKAADFHRTRTNKYGSNLRIPIETGRWYNIPKDEMAYTLCGQSIGDEFHLLFVCCNEYLVNLGIMLLILVLLK
jgi:hypothetical protein